MFFTKSYHWKYEKEWRNSKPKGNNCYKFPAEIKKIFFGLNCPQQAKDELKSIFGVNMDYSLLSLSNNYDLKVED